MVLCLICVVMSVVPASAATSVNSSEYITLDDGSHLFVPSVAVHNGNFMVVRQTGRQLGTLIIEKTRYVIYSLGSIGSGMSGGEHGTTDTDPTIILGENREFVMYKTNYFVSEFDALAAEQWEYDSYKDNFIVSGDIVYSTFDYRASSGDLIYSRSDDVQSDHDDPALDNSQVFISPVRNYSGMLPPLSSLTSSYVTDNWAIFRKPYSLDWDEDGFPIYSADMEWRYQLYFFSDDYSVSFGYRGTSQPFEPYIKFNAAKIYVYDLQIPGSSDGYHWVTDSVLEQAGKNFTWGALETYTGSCGIMTDGYLVTEMTSNPAAFREQMSNLFVASNFSVSQAESGPWYTSGLNSATSYILPAFSWSVTLFDLANDSTPEEEEESGIIAWLQKIYYGMVSGFERVINAIGLGGDDTPAVDDVPGVDENLDPDEEGDGFSLSDIFGSLWDFVKKIFGGLWKLLSGIVDSITGFIGDFFDLITDSDSNLFDVFDDSEPAEGEGAGNWYYIGNFFAFLQNLWICIPTPIKSLIYASFSILIVFGLLKMFH